ncbi:MAG: hydrogenase [Candidatus Riflebacteria bacterium]|nr:hydrogenase [Candidatus Riflebacteria bacterium]
MSIFQICLILPIIGGLGSLITAPLPKFSKWFGASLLVLGSIIGLFLCIQAFFTGNQFQESFSLSVPFGDFKIGLDSLSTFFLFPVFLLGGLGTIYGTKYMDADHSDTNKATSHNSHPKADFSIASFSFLVAGMALVLVSRNALLFLIAWELMTVASFFLVVHDGEKPESRDAGFVYLVAAHFGTAFLIFFFLFLATKSGSLDFDSFTKIAISEKARNLLFIFAFIGFGTKAGLIPFHVWLPEAHPAAPSHVSAIMSGIMIKTGIYGLMRAIFFLGLPQQWWGFLLMIIGTMGGLYGILFALAQTDFKRLLAYSSVENAGIIALGLGTGVVCASKGLVMPSVLALSGAFLHILNHSLYKSLMFLGAGVILHSTGSRDINFMGGLLKIMPRMGISLLTGAAAISGLPPLNGFISEFLIYSALFSFLISSISTAGAFSSMVILVLCITGLALIGGLATACFAKFFGLVFLGEPRNETLKHLTEPSYPMLIPIMILAFLCVLITAFSSFLLPCFTPIITIVSGFPSSDILSKLEITAKLIRAVVIIFGFLVVLIASIANLRRHLLKGRKIESSGTWDCGYAQPSSSMQYRSFSFIQPLTEVFSFLLRPTYFESQPSGILPSESVYKVKIRDLFQRKLIKPIFSGSEKFLFSLHWIQQGQIQVYILYLALALAGLLVWNLW